MSACCMASAKDEELLSRIPLTSEEEVGEAPPVANSRADAEVSSSSVMPSWLVVGSMGVQLGTRAVKMGSVMGCSFGCMAARIGEEEYSTPGMKGKPGTGETPTDDCVDP